MDGVEKISGKRKFWVSSGKKEWWSVTVEMMGEMIMGGVYQGLGG